MNRNRFGTRAGRREEVIQASCMRRMGFMTKLAAESGRRATEASAKHLIEDLFIGNPDFRNYLPDRPFSRQQQIHRALKTAVTNVRDRRDPETVAEELR